MRRIMHIYRRLRDKYTLPGLIICALGLLTLAALYVIWWSGTSSSVWGRLSALASVALFAAVCLRFVPGWMRFWTPGAYADCERTDGEPARIRLRIFAGALLWCLLLFGLIYLIYRACGRGSTWESYKNFWLCLDSGHYVDIARDWYLSEGIRDRLVQLVFLPGYPIAIRLMNFLIGDYVVSGLLVSWLSFAGACSVIYSLLRLDYSHEVSLRTVRYLCIIPGVFFFISPMSESLFLLLSAGCVYLARRGKTGLGCLLGAYAAFTRSLGLMLFVPVCMELVHVTVDAPRGRRRYGRFLWLLLIPAGFAAYCLVNYQVSGNPFQYLIYQREHWGQEMGLFFNTAAYQLDNLIGCWPDNLPNLLGLWLPNVLFDFAALAVMVYASKKMRPGYAAWFIAYYVITIGATWLLSAPRYMISLLPFFLGVSLTASTPKRNAVLTVICAALSVCYTVMFVLRWQVW